MRSSKLKFLVFNFILWEFSLSRGNFLIASNECGISAPTPALENRMIGDNVSARGDWPWLVAFFDKQNETELKFLCGASLVSQRHVVSRKI